MKNLMLATVFALLAAAPAFAQDAPADSRWTPYLGCWQIVQEHVGDQSVPTASGLMVCVRPSGRSGVVVTTTVDGKNVLEQTIVADGSPQPLTQADCTGNQTSEWSRDGERLFTRVELQCAGRPARVVSGLTQLAKGHWIDAQATVVDGDHDVRLRRYQRTSDQFSGTPSIGGGPMSVEDVIEASKKVFAPALEAALVEAGGRFVLDSRTLKQLADADVSPNVIDLMVAQAHPDRFQIERPGLYPPAPVASRASSGGGNTTVIVGSAAYPYPMYDPFYNSYYYYSPFAYPYYWGASYYPYRYNYGYGYGYRNFNNNYYYPGPYYGGGSYGGGNDGGRRGGVAQPGSPDHPGGTATAIKGRGYTRVRPSGSTESSDTTSAPAQRTNTSGRGARGVSSGGSSSSGSSSGGGSISGGSSSGSSSSGSSGSSSSGGGGRTAQPK